MIPGLRLRAAQYCYTLHPYYFIDNPFKIKYMENDYAERGILNNGFQYSLLDVMSGFIANSNP